MVLPRVLPDTNVCYPISLLDLTLRVDEANLHRFLWSEDLLDELARVWVRNGARTLEEASRICQQIRDSFPDQKIHRANYVELIPTIQARTLTIMCTLRRRFRSHLERSSPRTFETFLAPN